LGMVEGALVTAIKLHCPTCSGLRNCEVVASHLEPFDVLDATGTYRIVRCRGCDRVFFQQDETMTVDGKLVTLTDSTWPPEVARKRPVWIAKVYKYDPDLSRLLGSVYTALDTRLAVLAAIGCRTTFDRATHVLGASAEISFAAKLEWLENEGWIGSSEKDFLEILTEAGSAAAHRGWVPDDEQLSFMMDILEAFVYRIAVSKANADAIKPKIPVRKPKAPRK
jgi:hypothetical protein